MKRLLAGIWKLLRGKADRGATQERSADESVTVPASLGAAQILRRSERSKTLPRERTLVIGVDFGTSSTKVMLQDLSDNSFEVFRWQPAVKGIASALLPSTITLRDGSAHFGIPPSGLHKTDVWLSSIKLCVLCRGNVSICRCRNEVARNGEVFLPDSAQPVPAHAVACLFLAYVFREVENRVTARFPNAPLVLLWNVGCPMDHLDVLDRQTDWEKMVGVAWQLHSQVSNPADVTLIAEATRLLDSFMIEDRSERSYFVQPEGLAAVKAFLESPHAQSKTYAIVDVGAGTTEVSFFFNGRIMTEPGQPLRPSYLADSTEAVGGSKIDGELSQAWGIGIEEARQRKEADRSQIPKVPSVGEICSQYERTCLEILKQRKLLSPHDKRFDLFVIGGGGRLLVLQQTLQHRHLPGKFVLESRQQLKPPKKLRDTAEFENDYDLLANACGLASSLDWEYYPPKEVRPMVPVPASTKSKPDVDELYPK
jgi:Ethanolamine utilization protein EutJ (predicted chaperonin)